jgi:serine/threonine-protein kinase
MDPERWRRVDRLFAAALELVDEAREAFLERACDGDPGLRQEVDRLLVAERRSAGFLSAPLGRVLPLGAEGEEGRRLGPYRLGGVLGAGGSATVYEGVRDDDQFRRRVAVKLLAPERFDPEPMARFRVERQILAQLEHPNIACLYDSGTTDGGRPFLVMELVEGLPIDDYADRHRLDVDERLELFRTVCSAVAYAHRNLLVHRDLKPENILVSANGVPKLLDFGIAKPLDPTRFAADVRSTLTGLRPMTLAWASPEQIQGRPITTASDVYSLGLLLYRLLTGSPAHDLTGLSTGEAERVILESEPARPSEAVLRAMDPSVAAARRTTPRALAHRLRGDLDTIARVALAQEPARRYASVDRLSEDLERHRAELPVRARPPALGYRAGKFVRRHRIGVAFTTVAAVLIASLLGVLGLQAARLEREREALESQRATAARERDKAEEALAFLVGLFDTADPTGAEPADPGITAREILDNGAQKITRELADRPEVRATLLDAIGVVYMNLGLYDQAAPLLEEEVAVLRDSPGTEDLDLARSLDHLAELEHFRGRFDSAERRYREALALRLQVLPNDDPDLADTFNNLGTSLERLGRFDEAVRCHREALAIRMRAYGPAHFSVAQSLHNLGNTLHKAGRLAESERAFRQALAMLERLMGPDHLYVSYPAGELGALLRESGRLDEAEALLERAYRIRREVLPAEHPNLAASEGNLGVCLTALGRYGEAEELLLASYRTVSSRDDLPPDRLPQALDRLIDLYTAWGKPEAADRYRARRAAPSSRRRAGWAGPA